MEQINNMDEYMKVQNYGLNWNKKQKARRENKGNMAQELLDWITHEADK